uniref:Uncharacterized protein n=1 Tax=Rhizophagus irregularis (strain DAOM 181602 / DAOM 197198 / MUCL 43194) TaxID=747089 RepID=U9U954_RHIID
MAVSDLALVKQLEDKESKINQLPVSRKENEKKELTPMQVDKKEEKFHKKGREEKEWKTPSPNQLETEIAAFSAAFSASNICPSVKVFSSDQFIKFEMIWPFADNMKPHAVIVLHS